MSGEKKARAESGPSSGDAPSRDLVGRTVGKYEIVRVIGGGGMGRVYEGVNTAIGKRVALKFIDKDDVSADSFARFQREAQAASAVESAHIVEIFDAGETDDGQPFIVMELLRGEDLGHRIRRLGKLDVPEALQITAQILRGLHRAHEAGIVHRDLKPDNVFIVDRDDDQIFAKIVDFGVSKIARKGAGRSTTITQEGTILGTPLYMSPEQAQAMNDVDGRSDIYSVGAILYEMLAGRPPHSGGTYEQVIVNICMKDAEDVRKHTPNVPEKVWTVLSRALSRDRDARIATAAAFLDELIASSDGVLTGRSVSSSDVRDREQTVIRSDRGSSGSKTLGAVSTVAAVPPQVATTAKSEKSNTLRNSLISGGVGLAIGIGVLVYVLANAGTPAIPASPAKEVIFVDNGRASGTASASAAASAAASAPTPDPTIEAIASAIPSASASAAPSTSAAPSASAKKPRVAPPPVPTPTGLHIMNP